MKTIWLHRVSYHAEAAHPLLERNYLTIGFSDLSSPDLIDNLTTKSDEEGRHYLDQRCQEEYGELRRNRHFLRMFVADMKAGDWVLVPKQGVFSIYEITEDRPFCIRDLDAVGLREWGLADGHPLVVTENGFLRGGGEEIDLGFARRVRPIQTDIARTSFADAALTSRMKVFGTTADISDLEASVRRSIDAHSAGRPIDLHATLLKKHTESTLEAIKCDLNPDKFEQLIAWYFKRVGASEVVRPSKNESGKEGDADIVATFDALRTIIYVQAKFHDGETDDWSVDQIIAYRDQKTKRVPEGGVMDDGYARVAWVVSAADKFTDESVALAQLNKVLLLNGKEFVKMLLNTGIQGLDAAFYEN